MAATCRRPGGGAIEFVLLQNGECIANNYKALWDQLGQAIAPYPSGPTAEDPRAATDSLMAVMPMFPLGTVLLPGVVLPLHVFEPRYQQLVRDCLETPTHEFGVALIDRGSEVGGGDTRSDVGVVAMMLQVAAMDGGRFAVVTVGTRRIRVLEWLDDDPYPRAEVEEWPDGRSSTCRRERLEATASHAAALCRPGRRDGRPVERSGDRAHRRSVVRQLPGGGDQSVRTRRSVRGRCVRQIRSPASI